MVKQKYIVVFSYLRQNARDKLTKISKKTGIPVTTIHDQIMHKEGFVKKYTALLDFEKLGFNARLLMALAVAPEDKNKLREFLLKNYQVNSLYSINNGYDFLAEGVFKQIKEAEKFIENLEQGFQIKNKQVHYITDELKTETFMSNPYLHYF
ncbi:Lrp/AsnC family transcriptional regulator [Candidatus Woesearchaeota archaeon]|nr:Lrp/AsnC family transcriptional regulator [Candidatus Woesearchaeota archaeon]